MEDNFPDSQGFPHGDVNIQPANLKMKNLLLFVQNLNR